MAVSKPNLITQSAQLHGVKRARDSAANRSMAQNAALGLDNFARLLQSDPSGTQNFMPQGGRAQGARAGLSDELLKAAGFQGAEPFNPRAMQGMNTAQRAMQMNNKPLMTAQGLQNLNLARSGGSEGAVLAMRAAAHKLKDAAQSVAQAVAGSMGKLSSMFESGREGVEAIGYDKVGGTSYGSYQIASNTGTFDEFLQYLDKHSPSHAKELRAAGKANTGSREGGVPDAWRAIARRDPEGFGALQHGFIEEKLYGQAAKQLSRQGLDESKLSPVLREVLFSTAVQHGPSGAARIMSRAAEGVDLKALTAPEGLPETGKARAEEQLIERVYSIRQEQFGSSASHVQKAVSNRLNSEMQMALNMLKTGSIG
jgi:hypothetical protein